jgi:hypothetical protein
MTVQWATQHELSMVVRFESEHGRAGGIRTHDLLNPIHKACIDNSYNILQRFSFIPDN